MHLLCPAVLADAKGLSHGMTAFFAFVGLLLWGFGWRWHRFWVVFAVTLTAGGGRNWGRAVGRHAGTGGGGAAGGGHRHAALEVAKITAFLSAGTAAWVAAQAVAPQAQELWAVFLSGGLLGVVLYRVWTMLATSLAGCCCSGMLSLCCSITPECWSAPEFAEKYVVWLNAGVVVVSIVGVGVQGWTGKTADEGKEKADKPKAKSKAEPAHA